MKTLRIFLTIIGTGLCLAIVPVFFPTSLMATLHQWLGLGTFPDAPITRYLARSTSLLYFIHGVVMLYVATHLSQLRPMVPLLGWLHVVLGFIMLGIDLSASMPWYWTALEGIPIAMTGGVILWLFNRSSSKYAPTSDDAKQHQCS